MLEGREHKEPRLHRVCALLFRGTLPFVALTKRVQSLCHAVSYMRRRYGGKEKRSPVEKRNTQKQMTLVV